MRLLIFSGLIFIIGCSYRGDSEQPVIRKFSWFSYVAGEDIYRDCNSQKHDQYRFVYNGSYNEQVRTYDINYEQNDTYKIKITVTEEADLSSISINFSHPNVYKPWRPKSSTTNVSSKNITMLKKTLSDIGFFNLPPPLSNLSSTDFYWLISACVGGEFFQNAYVWPNSNFKNAQFSKLLNLWDYTDIPINIPRIKSDISVYGEKEPDKHRNYFNLKFGRNGLLSKYVLD